MKRRAALRVVGLLALAISCSAHAAPPVAPVIPSQQLTEGVTGSFSVPAFSDPDGDTLSYSYSGLPAWLSVYNPSVNPRYLLGTPPYGESGPSSNKTYWITATATDTHGERASKAFSLTVLQANGPPQRPESIPAQSVDEMQYFSYSVPVFPDPDGDAVSYSFAGLPSWLTVYNPASNPRYLYGRAPYSDSGPNVEKVYWITVTASDPQGASSSRAFSLTVHNVNAIPEAPEIPDHEVREGRWVQYAVPRFYDADGDVLSYTFEGLPSWLSVYNPAKNPRYLYGRVPDGDAVPNLSRDYPITVTATDPNGAYASQQWILRTLAANLRVTPLGLSFGEQSVGETSVAQSITVSNTSSSALPIASISLGGVDALSFAQTNDCPGSLAASTSCTVNVTFSPTTTGPKTASLGVVTTVGSATVALGGTGISITLTPTLEFNANPLFVGGGQVSSLTWTSANTSSCTASGGWSGSKPTSGSETSPPVDAATTFTLTCGGPNGSIQRSVTVEVNTVSGVIYLPSFARYDRDVNDPNSPYQSNDDGPNAQPLPNPTRLGGYVNEALRGPAGRSYDAGDLADVYRANIAAGQVVELIMPTADPALPDESRDDADLYLYDSVGNLVDSSEGTGTIERVTAPTTGSFYIEVYVYSGAVIYNLTIGQATSGTGVATGPRASEEIIPGQVIVNLRSGSDAVASSQAAARSRAAENLEKRFGLRFKAGDASREMLFDLPLQARDVLRGHRPAAASLRARGWKVSREMQVKLETIQFAKLLNSQPDVEWVDLNRRVRTTVVPNDPLYGLQGWHYQMMALPSAWDVTTGSSNVVVAVIDTGVVPHPDLAGRFAYGYDFISDPSNSDGDGLDPDADDPGCILGGNSSFHGTHVAGTVAALSNNGFGVAGVSWSSRIMPIRVLDGCQGSGSSYDVLQGVRYAAGLSNDAGVLPAQRADVINLSLGRAGACSATEASVYSAARSQGVIVVAAAGNDNSSEPHSPSSCAGVVSVSSVGPTRERAYYSNYGSTVDVAAPGGDLTADLNGDGYGDGILSTIATGGGASRSYSYEIYQGTSMASPGVAGVMALMKSVNPALTPAQVDSLLSQGLLTDDIGTPGADELGIGLINAFKAVQAAGGPPPNLSPLLSVTPTSLNFGDVGVYAEVVVSNGGTGALTLNFYQTSDYWLDLYYVDADPTTNLGRWGIQVDRTGLSPGAYSGWMDFISSAGTQRVNVLMEVSSQSSVPDMGYQYILLIDAATDEVVTGDLVHVQGVAQFPYLISYLVPGGEHLLYSGTDMNNDGYICDDGEACGAYPSELRPEIFTVQGETLGVDFSTSFRTSIELSAVNAGYLLFRQPSLVQSQRK